MKKKTKILLLQFATLIVVCSLSSKLLLGFVWVILHEAAHILVAKGFGINLFNIYLHITGVSAEIGDLDELSENKRLLVFLAGPLFNMGAIIILIWLRDSYNIVLGEGSILINIGLLIFNLLPAYPLDGVRIYEIILGRKKLYKNMKKILVNISFGVVGTLTVLFILTIYIHKANFSLLLAAILIAYSTFLEKEKTMYILMGNIIKKRKKLIKENYIENKSISVYYKRDLVKVLSLIDRNKFNSFFVLDEELQLLGIIYEDELINALKNYGNMTLEEFVKKKHI
ncbi:site-2 protease family protein [Clostridium vincentii]|uniref:Peptidase family M50 n=1 Tax=Clostridium vincentii TaxID=52704 RepID=A0A2T0BEY5_9CLOT|nr:site-2 protease family protein [Clostridium vincentii]PRR82434.1 Peptidase family M50 [Clostridium vincentii]